MQANHVLFTFIAVFAIVAAQTPFEISLFFGNYKIQWEVVASEGTKAVRVTQTFKGNAWMGVGWHQVNSTGQPFHGMTACDFVVATFDSNGQPAIQDMFSNDSYANGFTRPVPDSALGGVDNIKLISGLQSDGVSTVTWERPLVTDDTKADWPLVDDMMHIDYAHGMQNSLSYHGLANRGDNYMVNWVSGEVKKCAVGC